MKITVEQTEQLYNFTRQHYVEHYDLQTELVDHLANGIEQQWQENPKLTFEEALQKEFKKFGVFGFMDVVEQRQLALTKKYNHIVWEHFKSFFKIPILVVTLTAIFLVKIILQQFVYADELALFLFVGLLVLFFTGLVISKRKASKKFKKSGKRWMFEEIVFNYGSAAGFTYLPLQLFIRLWEHTEHPIIVWVTSCVLVAMALLEYILLVQIPNKAEEYLREVYPEKYI
ncbi:hypothetical protein [Flavobacterium sp.]|uniref:hypothetical protein n=1 Tax=Flavobacterium sp. TaxID=239 RepID=UPI0028BE5D05|nr:hypothetical protein [Flavobacterium sp.]